LIEEENRDNEKRSEERPRKIQEEVEEGIPSSICC